MLSIFTKLLNLTKLFALRQVEVVILLQCECWVNLGFCCFLIFILIILVLIFFFVAAQLVEVGDLAKV